MELVQQEVQVYSSPDDFFATFDDDSRERVKEWRQDCNDVDQWLNKYDPKLRDERDDENVTGLKEQLREIRVSLQNVNNLSVCLSVCLSIYLSIYLSIDRSIDRSIDIDQSSSLSIYLFGSLLRCTLKPVVFLNSYSRKICQFMNQDTCTWSKNTMRLQTNPALMKTRKRRSRMRWVI